MSQSKDNHKKRSYDSKYYEKQKKLGIKPRSFRLDEEQNELVKAFVKKLKLKK